MIVTVREPARDVPVACEVDVCVVGGGCTGAFAAVRAARLGASVAIVEKLNCFGGMATAGSVNLWHSLYSIDKSRQIIGGLTQETMERLSRRGCVRHGPDPADIFVFNPEELKGELDALIVESGVRPFLHTYFAAPVVEDGRLVAIAVENKGGRRAIRARQFIDATGDGDLAFSLGLPALPREPLQPPTVVAKLQGMATLGKFDWQKALSEHGPEFGLEQDWGWGNQIPGLDDISMRCDIHIFNTDVGDPDQLTHAEIEGRRKIRAIVDTLKKYGPDGSRIGLVDMAATMGGRESRRVAGVRTLSGDDILAGRRFDDAIGNGTYPVDIHTADGAGISFMYLDGTSRIIPNRSAPEIRGRWRNPVGEDPQFYQIPYHAMLQDAVPNLVLAGRMINADRKAFSAVRVMVNMNQTGEAAGVACVVAEREGCALYEVPAQTLRKELADGGSIII